MNRHANTLAVSPRYASQAGFLVLAKNVFAVAGQSRPYSTHSTTPKAGFRNAPLHLVLLGAPGAGKGTQTDTLLRKYPLNALVVGNLLRDQVSRKSELGKQAAKIMKAGGLLDDATILQVVKPELHKMIGTDWILDGFPRTRQQARDLDEVLGIWGESINLVVQLDVPDEILMERIAGRWLHLPSGRVYNTTYNPPKAQGLDDLTGDRLIRRMDDKPEVFQKRLDQYHQENKPLMQYYKERGALATLSGRTSAEIWPKLEKEIQTRFPHIQAK